MILSKMVVTWLDWIIEIGLWLFIIGAFVAGFSAGNGFFGSLIGGIVGLLGGAVTAALVFGFFIVVMDIRRMLKKMSDEKVS